MFYFLIEDYVEVQTAFVRELDLQLERFARNLGDTGAVVRPFAGDIDSTKQHVLKKNWTKAEMARIEDTPGLLMINVDFDEFDPRQHEWFHLGFGDAVRNGKTPAGEYKDLLANLADAIKKADTDLFKTAHSVVYNVRFKDAAALFSVKPGLFGVSIDLARGAGLLNKLREKLLSKP